MQNFLTQAENILLQAVHSELFLLCVICVFAGLVIGLCTFFFNKEGKKHGFKKGKFFGMSAKIDRKISREYLANEYIHYKDDDDLEQHANKKWK